MCKMDSHNLLEKLCLLATLLLIKSISADHLQDEQSPFPQAEAQGTGKTYRKSTTTSPEWMTSIKDNDLDRHPMSAAVAEMPDYISTPYMKRGTTYKKFARGNIFASNIRPFQQLGHYAISLNRRRLENQMQKEPIRVQPLPPSPITIMYRNREHDPLTPMALSQMDDHERDSDNKRTVFLSNGWAPSGLGEGRMKINSQKPEVLDNKKTGANSYAFTSNHWGPMGKRKDVTSQSEYILSRNFGRPIEKETTSPEDLELMGNLAEIGSNDVIQTINQLKPMAKYFNGEEQLDSKKNDRPNLSVRTRAYFMPLNFMSHSKGQIEDYHII